MNASEQSSVPVSAPAQPPVNGTGDNTTLCSIVNPQKTPGNPDVSSMDAANADSAGRAGNADSAGSTENSKNSPGKSQPSQPQPKNMASKTPPYFYTQRDFWGGPTLSYPIFVILSYVGGLIGLDHLYARSPSTAVLKTITNIFTLGFWYFYDIIQVTAEPDYVKANGLAMPFYGPAGIAAGSFLKTGESSNNSSPLMFLAFAIAVFVLPYGLDYVIAGDMKGAVMKMLSTFWFFGIIYGVINIYKLVMHPERVLCEGTSRYAPFTFIGLKERYTGATFINKDASKCPSYESKSSLLTWLLGVFNHLKNLPVVGAAVGTATAAIELASKTVATVKDGVQQAAEVAAEVTQIPRKLDDAAAKAASQPAVAPVLNANEGAEDPKPPNMAGGGGPHLNEPESTIISMVFALIFIGAAYMKGKDALTATIQRTLGKPPPLGTQIQRTDMPPAFEGTLGITGI